MIGGDPLWVIEYSVNYILYVERVKPVLYVETIMIVINVYEMAHTCSDVGADRIITDKYLIIIDVFVYRKHTTNNGLWVCPSATKIDKIV